MKTLVLVIDFINDIVHPNGKIAASAHYVAEHHVIDKVNNVLTFARANNYFIAHVKVGFSENYIECPAQSPLFGKAKEFKALQLNTWGTEFHAEVAVHLNDPVIIKHRVSALYATDLETILRAQKIEKIIICGVSTNMAVETVARELHDRDYQVVIVQDACAAATAEIHQASLKTLERIAKVCSSAELVQ